MTGTFAANRIAAHADVVLGVGTRWSDFTTASKTAFRDENVRFVNVNVADFDAAKHAGLALVGDARATLERLSDLLEGWAVDDAYREESARLNREWDAEVSRLYALEHDPPAQSAVIGAVNDASRPRTSSSARPARCPATCTSSGARATRRATTSSTATRAWATRSPAASA